MVFFFGMYPQRKVRYGCTPLHTHIHTCLNGEGVDDHNNDDYDDGFDWIDMDRQIYTSWWINA